MSKRTLPYRYDRGDFYRVNSYDQKLSESCEHIREDKLFVSRVKFYLDNFVDVYRGKSTYTLESLFDKAFGTSSLTQFGFTPASFMRKSTYHITRRRLHLLYMWLRHKNIDRAERIINNTFEVPTCNSIVRLLLSLYSFFNPQNLTEDNVNLPSGS